MGSSRSRWRVGADGRHDDIGRVGLFRTSARRPVSTVREDAVRQGSVGLFASKAFRVTDKLRTYLGVRYDHFDFDYARRRCRKNSGKASDGKLSLRAA